jgi:hypothetical protein
VLVQLSFAMPERIIDAFSGPRKPENRIEKEYVLSYISKFIDLLQRI